MKFYALGIFFGIIAVTACNPPQDKTSEFDSICKVDSGSPVSVMLTSYSTTLLANGKDQTRLRIAVTDSIGREIVSASDSVKVFISGDGQLKTSEGKELILLTDSGGAKYAACKLTDGICRLQFIAGTKPDKVKIEARSGKLWPGAHEIHTLPADFVIKEPEAGQLIRTVKPIDRMIGADISFLPQIEDRGKKFIENGKEIDAIKLLKEHGFNYIRLRVFVNPENEKGYAPNTGFCGLQFTLAMAMRIKEAGMKILLDFHYSDYWADPQQQFKPLAWEKLDFKTLQDSVKAYTTRVLSAMAKQGTLPAMVQVGNEINHGMLWPDGHISNPDQLAALLKAGVEGVEAVDSGIPVMMHIALGGQNEEAVFWLNNMIARGLRFDIIGLSYYPRWHGTLDDLKFNLNDLARRYHKPINVVEYADFMGPIHNIVFSLPDSLGKGACIWEPLNMRSGLFDKAGAVTNRIQGYDEIRAKYLLGQK